MVTNEQQVKTLFAEANPIPDADLFDLDEIGGTAYLATLETRSSEVTQLDTKGQNQKEKKSSAPWLVAAAVAIVAGIGLIVVNQGDEAPLTSQPVAPAATNPPVTSEAAPTTVDQAGAAALTENALASVDAWFDAYNTGNDEAVLELLAPGVRISDQIIGIHTLDDWTMNLAWNTAQGTIWTPHNCAAASIDDLSVPVTVSCSTGNWLYTAQAVDAPSVPTNLVAIVTTDGISELRFGYGKPDFNESHRPFIVWMAANHPGIVEAGSMNYPATFGYDNWDGVDEARKNGQLTAQYSEEWAAYLEENGCAYDEGC